MLPNAENMPLAEAGAPWLLSSAITGPPNAGRIVRAKNTLPMRYSSSASTCSPSTVIGWTA